MSKSRVVGLALVTAALAVGLGGCRYYWHKPETTAAVFERDNAACLEEARSATPATAKYNVVIQDVYRACLQARGYQREKRMSPPAGSAPEPGYHRGHEFD